MPVKFHKLSAYYRKMAGALRKAGSTLPGGRGKRRLRRVLLVLLSIIFSVTVLAILFISPLTKYLIEKYDQRFTGRQITIDRAYVNPFTGYFHFSNFRIFELKSDSTFFSSRGVNADIAVLKLLRNTYEISEITFNQPRGNIIMVNRLINFSDLIDKFTHTADSLNDYKPVHFNILNVTVNDGEFHFIDKVTPISYFIKKVNIVSTGMRWDGDSTAADFSFLSGIGSGGMKGSIAINYRNLEYRLALVAEKFDLNILEQYLRDLTNYGYFAGNLDARLKVKGNFKTAENVSFSGNLAISDFHSGDRLNADFASFDKLALVIFELSPSRHKYLFDSVTLSKPYFRYELYDQGDNLQNMFGGEGAGIAGTSSGSGRFNLVITIGNYIKRLSKNFFRSDYIINRLAVSGGNLEFSDFSVSEQFSANLTPLNMHADSIDKNNSRVHLYAKSGIKPYGNANVTLSINPKDSSDFDLQYHLQNLPAALFNPYTISYTSFPLDRGTISLNGSWHVRNGIISSNNHLLVIDPRVAKRLKNKDNQWMPVPLIMAFVRESGNVIDYEIPISGDLRNPKFHLKDAVFDLLRNIFVKPPRTPYRMHVKNLETEIEKSLTLNWPMRQSGLSPLQEKFVNKMANFLVKNPEATISVFSRHYQTKEKEYILLFEAKKKYFLAASGKDARSFSEPDSIKVEKMSAKDTLFVRYLNRQVRDLRLFTVQEKCTRLIGNSFVNSRYSRLVKDRKTVFMARFSVRGVEKRVMMSAEQHIIPYNGFSFYKIEYKGEYPDPILRAYRQMNDLNNESPRSLFKKERRASKGRL